MIIEIGRFFWSTYTLGTLEESFINTILGPNSKFNKYRNFCIKPKFNICSQSNLLSKLVKFELQDPETLIDWQTSKYPSTGKNQWFPSSGRINEYETFFFSSSHSRAFMGSNWWNYLMEFYMTHVMIYESYNKSYFMCVNQFSTRIPFLHSFCIEISFHQSILRCIDLTTFRIRLWVVLYLCIYFHGHNDRIQHLFFHDRRSVVGFRHRIHIVGSLLWNLFPFVPFFFDTDWGERSCL